MAIKLDCNLEKVLSFMERNVEADKLVRTAALVAALAPLLWGETSSLSERALTLMPESFREQLSTATISAAAGCAGDGSGAAMGVQQPTYPRDHI
jgi:hypothetical protein